MTIKYHNDIIQGTPEWHELRRGIITASEVSNILTPTLAVANNDKTRALVYRKAAEIISGVVDDTFSSYHMERGNMLEPFAISEYEKHHDKVQLCGFVVNTRWGNAIGYSPDGLVGDSGLIEIKSPERKKHVEYLCYGDVPKEYWAQVQTGLLVTGREWIDFISYHPGMAIKPVRVKPCAETHQKIIGAITEFYAQVNDIVALYNKNTKKAPITEEVELNTDGDIEV